MNEEQRCMKISQVRIQNKLSVPNRAFVFSRNDNTCIVIDRCKNNRLTLVYNLRSDKY
ncbi:MAG: hypothetical protein CM15mV8_1590 [Caudoviricetes sp.]|nr:MAG: hypothetical protein CM15mV8_1590 [Caudoviricetes sp.]